MADGRKRIVVEFREKGRRPGRSEFMADDEAQAEFDRVAELLAESGPEGDRLIRVGKELLVRAREVHNMHFERPATMTSFELS